VTVEQPGKRRGRPIGFDPEDVVRDLVMLFWEKGYEDTTQADMVERTGLSSSSLYNTFGDKPAIFGRVLERYNEWVASACQPMLVGGSGLGGLEEFVEWRLAHVLEPVGTFSGCLMVTTMCERGAHVPQVEQQCEDYRAIQRKAISAAIDRAVNQQEIVPGDTDVRAALLVALSIGAAATARSTTMTGEAIAMIEGMRQLVHSWTIRTET